MKQTRDDLALQALESIDLSLIKVCDESQTLFITETLDNFHTILMASTVDLWTHHLQKACIEEASLKLKNKMEASRATASTAKAIERATKKFQNQKNRDAIAQLRLGNLDKLLQHQQQTSKEILNHIQNNNNKQKKLKKEATMDQ